MFYRKKIQPLSFGTVLPFVLLTACASAPKVTEEEAARPLTEIRTEVGALNARIAELEAKLGSLNGKLESLQTAAATDQTVRTAAAPVIPHPADRAGTPVSVNRAPSDPDAGFVADEAVQDYRKALVLLQSKQYSDAVLAFSHFLEQNPDHVLAGSAQYYVGEAYLQQKEYKLALQEFRRVLASYDRSAQVPQALNKMALAEEALNMKEEARAHRQLLSSLYPQSPAAEPGASSITPSSTAAAVDEPPPTAPLNRGRPENRPENRDDAQH